MADCDDTITWYHVGGEPGCPQIGDYWVAYYSGMRAEVSEYSTRTGAMWLIYLGDTDTPLTDPDESPTLESAQLRAENWMMQRTSEFDWCAAADEA